MQLAAHEIGTGAYTLVAITAAHSLGLKVEDMTVMMGDSDLPPVTVAGGSNNALRCNYANFEECRASASGGLGYCVANPASVLNAQTSYRRSGKIIIDRR